MKLLAVVNTFKSKTKVTYLTPVSYTNLDVYKRQVLWMVGFSVVLFAVVIW